jgi:hypothetical protein
VATLQSYIFATQRLLHDANAQIWPVSPDLVYYINLGRDRVALDTLATRILPIIALNANQERYVYSTVQTAALTLNPPPMSRAIATIYGINCIQSSAYQPPLKRRAWTEFNAEYRTGGPLQPGAFPDAWSQFGDNQTFYIAAVPGTPLTAEIDCTYLPINLVNTTDIETAIADPLSELVPLMAARWAMYYQDDFAAAEKFLAHYKMEKDEITAALPHFSGFN